MMDVVLIVLKAAGVLILVLLNGFFVAAEFAIVKVRATQIEPLVRQGSRRARVAQHVITHLDSFLSASQLGITITSLGLGWVGEPFVADMLIPVFASAGMMEPALVHTVSFIVAFSIITYLHIVLGELAPKSMAIQFARQTTLAIARPMNLFHRVFNPFIWFLNWNANAFLRLVGIEPVREHEIAHSEEELRILLSKGKAITSTVKNISLRAIELRDRTIREVMVPRTGVVVLSTRKTVAQNITVAMDAQFTRYPLCEKDLDNVVGMIHLKDLFKLKGEDGPGTRLLEIKREMLFVPETMSLDQALNLFLTKRVLMAIAVDEYGGTAGLVTLENVLEELVGEIRDEFDVEPAMVQRISESESVVDGAMPLFEFCRMFDVTPTTRDVVTVSGYIIHLLGHVPEKGTSVRVGSWTATVEALDGVKVRSIRLRRARQPVGEHV